LGRGLSLGTKSKASFPFRQNLKKWVVSSKILSPLYSRYKEFRQNLPFYFKKRNWLHRALFFGKAPIEETFFKEILKREKIDIVLDVGAHAGETGWVLRDRAEYTGKIVSFEPLNDRFAVLEKRAQNDPPWTCYKLALGNENGIKKLNVFSNQYASSFLNAANTLERELCSQKVREDTVQIRRLEDLYPSLCKEGDSVLLKMDTQGFEKSILEGLGKYLSRIRLIRLEASCVPLYEGETLIGEMILFLQSKGFELVLLIPGHVSDESHHLQVDLLFLNRIRESKHEKLVSRK
jgi:FkbM family methyltransferase